MKRVCLTLLFFALIWTSFTQNTLAQNKAGINIGTKYGDIDRAIGVVGSGGWIVVIAGGTGDCANLQGIIDKANAANVNLVIRGHLNNQLTPNDALAWAATLGQLNTSHKLYFMPWNEPNQTGSADYGDPDAVSAYCQTLRQDLNDSGVAGKIFLLSPMINQSHPNFNSYVSSLGGGGFFNIFDGIAMNLYDFGEENCGSPLCHPDAHLNPARYADILSIMGASGKPAFGVESGTAGGNFYWKQPPSSSSPLYRFVERFFPVAPQMFAIPSYDLAGEAGHSWSLFNPSDVTNLLGSQPKGGASPASFDQTVFENWLKPLVQSGELIACQDCGFAHKSNLGLCNGTSGFAYTPSKNCDLNNIGPSSDQKTSRPVACEDCNRTVDLTTSCATSFEITDEVKYRHKNSDNYCLDQHWVEKTWTGTVIVDPNQAIIPFVGKKGDENEQKYLADYFEGTAFYYKPPYDLSNPQDIRRVFLEGGVWRKLAPLDVQDNYKIAMVRRAIDSKTNSYRMDKVRDYLVSYNGESARLTDFANHFPPTKQEDPSGSLRREWDKTMWGRLWPAVPMFTREDTPGEIVPYLGAKVKDSFQIQDTDTTIDKVPHVARLYEVTKAINRILLPKAKQAIGTADTKTNNGLIIATAKNVPSNLLAQAPQQTCAEASIVNPYIENYRVRFTFQVCQTNPEITGCLGDPNFSACGSNGGTQPCIPALPDCFRSDHPAIAPPVPIACPGSADVSAGVLLYKGIDSSCPQQHCASCRVTVDSSCKIINTTCGASFPPLPACGLPPASPVNACEKDSISGEGDTLCCSQIRTNLSAVDQFVNPHYESCDYDPITGILLNPSCNDEETQAVSRKVGISLSHPYLEKIWENTTELASGFFNIIRFGDLPEFEPTEASTRIRYGYEANSGKGGVSPVEGDFYYPYLGGIQKAKEFFLRNLLGTNTSSSLRPPGSYISSSQLGYSIDVTNTSQTVKPSTKDFVIQAVKNSWPNTKIEQEWDHVVNRAIQAGLNPVLVLAIWIEESGASGVPAHDLGFESCPENNLDAQLDCFANISYKDAGFEEFMCLFAEGEHHVCIFDTAINFPKNLRIWYERLSQ